MSSPVPGGQTAGAELGSGLNATAIHALADRLLLAEANVSAIDPLREEFDAMTVMDAYRVQQAVVGVRLQRGAKVVGHKIGCTSLVIQEQFGIDQPDYGTILDDMVLDNGAVVPAEQLIAPRVEPELAFVLGKPLIGPGVSTTDVLDATLGVVPCLEIIDSRIRDWDIRFVDTVADNGSSARCVLGDVVTSTAGLDLRLVGVVLERNGSVVSTGAGAAALDSPAAAVAWLANALGRHGASLAEGDIVLSGALTSAPQAAAGDTFRATFSQVGSVVCRFSRSEA